MTTFDGRERAFEAAFAHDQDVRFRAVAHRNNALGSWAADRLGKAGNDAQTYAQSVVTLGITKAGDDAVLDKVFADFDAAGKPIDRAELEQRLVGYMIDAIHSQTVKV